MATASLPSSCEEQQNNNLDEYSDDSDAESEKVRKAKKAKKPDNEKWSSSLICNLIDEYEARPCLWNIFCDDYHNRDVTGKAKKELEDKENTSRKAKGSDKRKGLRQVGDPYDADSEPEPAAPLTSMLIDQNIPLDRQPFHSRLSSLHAEHSTPSLPSSDHHISDCFGFDNMAISLPISPVRGEPMVSSHLVLHSPGSASVTSSITSISPGKRKADQRIFDVPIEKPIKKIKKRKPNKLPDVTEDDDWVVEMKSQFEEIEMLDLVID